MNLLVPFTASSTSHWHEVLIGTPKELIFAHPIVQSVSRNTQKTCCTRSVPIVFLQRTLEHLFLDSKQTDSGRREIDLERILSGGLRLESCREIIQTNFTALGQDNDAFNRILEFTYIAREARFWAHAARIRAG